MLKLVLLPIEHIRGDLPMLSFAMTLFSRPVTLSEPRRPRSRPSAAFRVWCFVLIGTWSLPANIARAQANTATATTLSVLSADTPTTSVSVGTVVSLSAIVHAGSAAVSRGQVNFCDASATLCTDIHLLGTAQLTTTGTASLKLRPGKGNHSYKAVFLGTNIDGVSSSGASTLTVTGAAVKFASISQVGRTGSFGNYTLSATITEAGGTAPPTGQVSFLDTSFSNAVLTTATLGPAKVGISWPNPQTITLNTGSQATALGDFNGDGIPDIASIAGGTYRPLIILLGNPDGTYTQAPVSGMSVYTYGPMVVSDFDGDGNQDLAILNGDTNVVTILLGKGDGTFSAAASSPSVSANPSQIAVADFNGDGNPDLVVSSSTSTGLTVLLGNGDGTFRPTANSPSIGGAPVSMAAGDLNGDGKVDLAVSDLYDDAVTILIGNGDGTFTAAAGLHSGSTGGPLTLADLNADGKLDLAVAVAGSSGAADSITVISGNGDGTFNSSAPATTVSSAAISSIQAGDFNGRRPWQISP